LLQEYLQAQGFVVQAQNFQAPRSYGPELILISLLLMMGGWLAWWWLALLGTYAFWAHFSGWWVPWKPLFDRYPSQNLIAESGSGSRTLVLMAHYDSAKTFFVYHPARVKGFRRNFLLNAAFATVLPFATFLPLVSQLLGLYFLIQALLLVHRELTQPYVNGANDNASGVVVAVGLFEELANRGELRDEGLGEAVQPHPSSLTPPLLANYRVILALTGCEEVGAKGAEYLLRSGRIPPDALVLNVDNVGQGELFYVVGEGMLVYHPYQGMLLQAARQTVGARSLEYKLAYFDTRPFAARGIPSLTLIRLRDGLPPNWHWPSDTPDHLKWESVEETLSYAHGLLRQLTSVGT